MGWARQMIDIDEVFGKGKDDVSRTEGYYRIIMLI